MSKAVKKIFKGIKDRFKKSVNFIKKNWKKIVVVAAVVFTAGAALGFIGMGAGGGLVFGAGAGVGGLTGVSTAYAALGNTIVGAFGGSAVFGGTTTAQSAGVMGMGTGGMSTASGIVVSPGATASTTGGSLATGMANGGAGVTVGGAGGTTGSVTTADTMVLGNGAPATTTVTGELAGAASGGMTAGEAMMAAQGINAAGSAISAREDKKDAKKAEREYLKNSYFFGVNGLGERMEGVDPATAMSLTPVSRIRAPEVTRTGAGFLQPVQQIRTIDDLIAASQQEGE